MEATSNLERRKNLVTLLRLADELDFIEVTKDETLEKICCMVLNENDFV